MAEISAGKMPLFEICIVNGKNRIRLDVPYGSLENVCRSLLFNGNKVEIVGNVFKNLDEL